MSENTIDNSIFFTQAITKKNQSQSTGIEVAAPPSASPQPKASRVKALFLPHLASARSLQEHQAQTADTTSQTRRPAEKKVFQKSHQLASQPNNRQLEATALSGAKISDHQASVKSQPLTALPLASLPLKTLAPATKPAYRSEQARARVKANPKAGHSVALNVLPGGNGQAIAGYGRRYRDSPRGTIPDGSTLLLLTSEGPSIADAAGALLESIDLDALLSAKPAARDRLIDRQLDSMGIVDPIIRRETLVAWEHVQILEEKSRFDDYQIEPPEDLSIFERSISVDKSTRLSDILESKSCYAVAVSTEVIDEQEFS